MPVTYSPEGASALENIEQTLCIICNENIDQESKIITQCNHSFHGPCLVKWLETSQTCPVCRQVCNSIDSNEQISVPTRPIPYNSRSRGGAVPRDRPTTRSYSQQQQQQRSLGSLETI